MPYNKSLLHFYIICGHFDENKIGRTTLPGVGLAVNTRGWGDGCNLFQCFDILNRHIEKKIFAYYEAETYRTCSNYHFSFCISKTFCDILIFQTFIATFWMFTYFSRKIANFQFCLVFWRHNYAMPWPIVPLLVWMDREDQDLSIDFKNQVHRGFIGGNLGRDLQNPPLVRRVTKNRFVRRGLT